jgi:hypothetical protein
MVAAPLLLDRERRSRAAWAANDYGEDTMDRYIATLLAVAALGAAAGGAVAQDAPAASDEELISTAEMGGPAAIASAASIVTMDATGTMTTLREGTNGWWCMPDNPGTPGPDPMCGDENSMEWLMAWAEKREPAAGKVGIAYMLAGGSDPDNLDPYATEPPQGMEWVTTGPHMMVMNAPEVTASYPEEAQPDTTQPFVMYPGTPYAHLMVPVE